MTFVGVILFLVIIALSIFVLKTSCLKSDAKWDLDQKIIDKKARDALLDKLKL